ncbi:MAG: electron transfer flavoprotein subunit alpha/FixB family protein, partial [Chitinophagaceae bacterium]
MSVLVFLDQTDGHIKKSSFEAAGYAAKTAELLGTTAEAILLGTVNDDLAALGNYGIKKVHTV